MTQVPVNYKVSSLNHGNKNNFWPRVEFWGHFGVIHSPISGSLYRQKLRSIISWNNLLHVFGFSFCGAFCCLVLCPSLVLAWVVVLVFSLMDTLGSTLYTVMLSVHCGLETLQSVRWAVMKPILFSLSLRRLLFTAFICPVSSKPVCHMNYLGLFAFSCFISPCHPMLIRIISLPQYDFWEMLQRQQYFLCK